MIRPPARRRQRVPRAAGALGAVLAVALLAGCTAGAPDVALRAGTGTTSPVVPVLGDAAVTSVATTPAAAAGTATAASAAAATGGRPAAAAPVTPGAPRPSTTALLAGMRLVNYQRPDAGWPALWTDWRPDVLDRDLARIAALGGNTVRVSVIPDTIGWPAPRPVMAARLAQYVDLAAKHGIKVQLTLFDWFGRLDATAQAASWARAVTAPYKGDSRVAFVELLNEVDPGDARTMTFLRSLLPVVRKALPGVPVTVSVSSTAGPDALRRLVSGLPGLLDVADIHFYGEGAQAYAWLGRAKAAAGGLPLVVGEAGHSLRYPVDTARDVAHHEALQAAWFDATLRAARDRGVPVGVWMLYDLTPSGIPGRAESANPQEYRFGLRRLDGTQRPAAAVVRSWWTGRPPTGFTDTFSVKGSDGLPAGWRLDRPDAARYARDATVGSAAAGSARISAASGDPLAVPNLFRAVPMDVRAGRSVRMTAQVRLSGGGAATVALGWLDASGRYLGGVQSRRAPSGGSWATLTVAGAAPAGARSVVAYLKASGVAGSAWFDDVRVAAA